MKRFYEILSKSTTYLLLWLSALTALILYPDTRKEFEENPWRSTIFLVLQLPLYCLVLFGCHALITIGWHLFILSKRIFLINTSNR